MEAYLIDPYLQRVNVIDLPDDKTSLDRMHRIIRCESMDSTRITQSKHGSSHGDYLWLDDGGLSRGEPVYAFKIRDGEVAGFSILGDSSPCAGLGIVIGCDNVGRTVAPWMRHDALAQHIDWLGLIRPQVDWVEEEIEILGKRATRTRAIVTYSRA